MSIPLESLEIGQCYLVRNEKSLQVRRVLQVMPDGRVRFERRITTTGKRDGWVSRIAAGRAFATAVVRKVPCDWTPESEDGT
jgi:hypothetical protein